MKTYIRLRDGNTIPVLGLGTWKSDKTVVGDAVRCALTKAGYTHIDCASIYRNEKEIGDVFGEVFGSSIKRDSIFITSKLWNTEHRAEDVEKACKKTLSDLRLEYLDLYLMHWGIAFPHGENLEPVDTEGYAVTDTVSIRETWEAMEGLVKKGLVKSIGVANFTTMMLVDLLAYAHILPVMNQVELHPYNTQDSLLAFCQHHAIAVTAYSPLGRQGADRQGARVFDEPVVKNLAEKYHKTPAQILLRWGIQRGTIVIPKSVTPDRIIENSQVFDFEMTEEDSKEIRVLDNNYRFVDPIGWWKIPYFV
ncbi:MAG: aldo/keto reductase [Microgenomates group bacterium]